MAFETFDFVEIAATMKKTVSGMIPFKMGLHTAHYSLQEDIITGSIQNVMCGLHWIS